MSPTAFTPNQCIVVTSCQGCPFAHLEAETEAERYCCIGKCLPTVTAHVTAQSQPADCPVLLGDYRITTAR